MAFGGHEMAAGLSIGRAELPAFASTLEAHAREELGEHDLVPRINHDGTVLLEEINLNTLHQMPGMAPFGMDNPEPLMVVESARAMRVQEVQGGHLRFTVCQGAFSHPAIAFGMLGRRQEFQGEIDLLVAPQINYYQGRETVQLRVKDVRQSAAACADQDAG
jgi:single-stranded-DNA-specific exonuclease